MKRYIVLSVFAVGIFLVFFGVKLAQADLNDGLVAYYPFNGNTNDESGNGHDGVMNGSIQFVSGISGQAADFDGISEYISVGNHPAFNNSNYTLSLWIKTTYPISPTYQESNGWTYLLAKGTDYDFQYGIAAAQSIDKLMATSWAYTGGSHYSAKGELSPIVDGSWHFVVGVITSTYSYLYVDGEISATATTQSYSWNNDGNASITIGGINWTADTGFFDGSIDEVRIYNRALSESEIQELYKEGGDCTDRYDEGYDAGKQACIDDPAACGIEIDEESICAQVITYGKPTHLDCWIEFSTPCDIPDNWEKRNSKPEKMCISSDTNNSDECEYSEDDVANAKQDAYNEGFEAGKATCETGECPPCPYTQNCEASFDMFTNTLHIPNFQNIYWLDFGLNSWEPVTFQLKDMGEIGTK